MDFHAQVVARLTSDRLSEGDVESVISRCGATVETIDGRIASNGCREFEIIVAFARYRALDEIVRKLGEVTGVAVTTVTLLPSRGDAGRRTEAL